MCWSKVGVKLVFFCVAEREMGKTGRKKGRGLRGNFHLKLFVRITFPFPWFGIPCNEIFIIFPGLLRRFTINDNHIGLSVSEILYTQR